MMVDVALHPEVKRYIDFVEEEARRKGNLRFRLGFSERNFLQNTWGPAMKYNFEGLHPGYPFIDHEGWQRFIDYIYIRGPVKLIIEIDGFTTHAKNISKEKFKDHLHRQNNLLYTGWVLIRFEAEEVEKEPHYCQAEILKAIGHCWSTANFAHPLKATEMWHHRRQLLQLFAEQEKGIITSTRFAQSHKISKTTAHRWIIKAVNEGVFEPMSGPGQTRIHAYRLVNPQNAA